MMNENADWKRRKEKAVAFGKTWVDSWLEKYKEPKRAGTPKDKPREFSKKKQHAALLMVLYNTLGLVEISELAKVSWGLLRLWRTEDRFKRVAEKACKDLAAHIVNSITCTLEGTDIDGIIAINKNVGAKDSLGTSRYCEVDINGVRVSFLTLIELLPFFNPITSSTADDLLLKRVEISPMRYIPIFPYLEKSYAFFKDPDDLKWIKTPIVVKSIKFQINAIIPHLTDPKTRKNLGDKKVRELGEALRNTLIDYLNLIAG